MLRPVKQNCSKLPKQYCHWFHAYKYYMTLISHMVRLKLIHLGVVTFLKHEKPILFSFHHDSNVSRYCSSDLVAVTLCIHAYWECHVWWCNIDNDVYIACSHGNINSQGHVFNCISTFDCFVSLPAFICGSGLFLINIYIQISQLIYGWFDIIYHISFLGGLLL